MTSVDPDVPVPSPSAAPANQTGPSGLAIAGFVLSIIGFFSAFLGGIIITIPALILCLIANGRRKSSLATAGWIIAAIGTLLGILVTVSRVMNS